MDIFWDNTFSLCVKLLMFCTMSTRVKNMWHDHISCFGHFDQDMMVSDVNT